MSNNKCCKKSVRCEVEAKATAGLNSKIQKELDVPDGDIEALINDTEEDTNEES